MKTQGDRKLRILLINPPHIQRKGSYPRVVFEPLGLSYLAAFLEREGHEVSILDAIGLGFDKRTDIDDDRQLVGLSYEDIAEHVQKESPEVVGIGIPFTIRAESAFAIASLVKKIDRNIATILGGIHVVSHPTDCLRHSDVDYVVIGEGERIVSCLLEQLSSNGPAALGSVKGIGYKEDGRLVVNDRAEPIEDLDTIPFPARHLLPRARYLEASKRFMTGRSGKKFACVITSRGCPFKCNFCESFNVMGRKWRYRSPENVVGEIEMLVNEYGINFIHFEDDNLTLNRDRIVRICELLIEKKLKIKWDTPNGLRADTINDEQVLRTMKKSGCAHLCVAPESGSQYVVNNIIRKNMDLGRVEQVVELCRKVGIRVDAFFVIGMVGETKEQMMETIAFARKLRRLGLSRCHFHIATPFEGTDIYLQAKEKGYLVEPPPGCMELEAPRIETPEFTVADVDRFFVDGCKLNPLIPTDKINLVFHLLMKNPLKLAVASLNFIRTRNGRLTS